MSRKRREIVGCAVLVLAVLASVAAVAATELTDWKFSRDGESWSDVQVPHDWAIAGPFDKEIDKQTVAVVQDGEKVATEKTGRTGALPWIGQGSYRRSLLFPRGIKWASLEFHGAMSEPEVLLDGKKIGEWKLGYASFLVEIPPDALAGTHQLEVRLNNRPLSSRWYPGAGLFRSVWLHTGGAVGIQPWGQTLVTPTLTKLVVSTRLRGQARVAYRILDDHGREVARRVTGAPKAELVVPTAKAWSPESPVLYTLVTDVYSGSERVETRRDRFGFRTIDFSDGSFRLNGVKRKFKGVCLHHDLGPLGAAFSKDAFRRQMRLLKEMGADSIRTSHNPPCPEQLEVCDEEGVLVMAESFDMWRDPKCKNGYALFYDAWWRRDLTNLIECNRNHPSVVLWSIGNEVPEQSLPGGREMAVAMQNLCHELDPSRPVTQGLDRVDDAIKHGMLQEMEVPGLNYRLHRYEVAWKATPRKFILGAETASTVSCRATYHFPVQSGKGVLHPDGQSSGYDVECCPWSNLPDDDWAMQDDHPWTVGEFVWTGFDYLGEPTPYNEYWPSRSSYFGILDLAGLPKDRYWLYRSRWNTSAQTLHICPSHWNFKERAGQMVPVYVYTDADEAELFLNGKSLGRRKKDKSSQLDRYRLRWNDVVYAPGELKAVAHYADGREKVEAIRTAGKVADVRVTAETYGKLHYFRVTLVDAKGVWVPDDDRRLSFTVKNGSFRGVCNGDPTSLEVFVKPTMKTFRGELVVVAEGPGAELAVDALDE